MRCRLAFVGPMMAALVLRPALAADGVVAASTGTEVRVRLDRGDALVVVTRTFENALDVPQRVDEPIDLPPGAVVTRLRTSVAHANAWSEGELQRASEAEQRFVRGSGGDGNGLAALLGLDASGRTKLHVYPVPPHGDVRVEYAIRLPVAYAEGRYTCHLPTWGEGSAASARVHLRAVGGEPIAIAGATYASEATFASTGDVDVVVSPSMDLLEGSLGSVATGKRALVSLRLAAGTLGLAPARAAVVVAIDTSRSMASSIDAEIALALGYLGGFPSADVTVLTYDRTVRAPFGGPLPVARAVQELAAARFPDANGSNLDEALAEAERIVARSSIREQRILVLGDLDVKDAIDTERLARAAGASRALVHVVRTRETGATSLTPDRDDAWELVPRVTGGLLWRASATMNDPTMARSIFEELVRPVHIDAVTITGMPDGWTAPGRIDEGSAVVAALLAPDAATRVTVRGELWSRPVQWTFLASIEEARRAAALAVPSELFAALDANEQVAVATYGRAVSSVTSFVAPGPRPPPEVAEGATVRLMSGTYSTRCSCHMGVQIEREEHFDPQTFLDDQLVAAAKACGAAKASLTVETTADEIVDVRDVSTSTDAAANGCVREATWRLALPDEFRRWPHQRIHAGTTPASGRECPGLSCVSAR